VTVDLALPDIFIDLAIGEDDDPWVEVASSGARDLLGLSFQQGADRFDGVTGKYEPGRLTSLRIANDDGRFDPTNLDGPYVADGRSQVHAMRGIRWRAVYDDPTIDPMFTGFIDAAPITYAGALWSQVAITATDGSAVLTAFDGTEQSPQGAGENTGLRIHRIADNGGWPLGLRDIDVGKTTVQATTLAQNAWTEMQLVADTELGELYFDGRGFLRFRNRHAMYTEDRSRVSQATFSNRPDGGALPWESIVLSNDLAQLRNRIRISRVGGTLQVVDDTDSQLRYGFAGQPLVRPWGRQDLLMEDDGTALQYANYVLFQSSDIETRFESMVIEPQANPSVLFPQVLGRRLGDRVTVVLFTPDDRVIERDVFIRGIHHSLDTGRWTTTWSLQDASKFSFFVLDDDTLGRLDLNRLAF
jgi:hypothetical protein